MNIHDLVGGNYIKAEDLTPEGKDVEISHVAQMNIGGENKAVLFFAEGPNGEDQGALPLNKTNALECSAILRSKDTDDWHGKTINLYRAKTTYEKKTVACVRVRAARESGAGQSSGSGSGSAAPDKPAKGK